MDIGFGYKFDRKKNLVFISSGALNQLNFLELDVCSITGAVINHSFHVKHLQLENKEHY